jgi:hypothetical protein
VSFSGLSIIFYADSDVLDGPFPPARFPQNWTYAAWEINPPAELFSGGQTSSYSAAIVGSSPTGGERRVLLAANEGIDSAACGNPGNKCRSIGQAIRNARAGDTVFVEVGVYGDLNGNGVLGEAGEEADRTGCGCVVHVDKAITVLSERGAAATIIDARSVAALSPFQTSVVSLGVSGASFGFIGQGFTVLASTAHTGIAIRPGALGVGVWGNRVSGADTGVAGPQADVSDNEITGNFTGISLFEGRVAGNVIARNSGDGIKITGAFAEGNAVIENNVVSGNGGVGMDLPTSTSFMSFVTGNDIVSNGAAGIHWRFGGAIGPRAVVQDNNIFGNRRAFGDHCGILNETYGLVWATDNYWGGLGVADRACDGPNATTVVDPVRTEPDSRVGP